MLVRTLEYSRDAGWSAELPEVDAERSLVLCFGASSYFHETDAITELAAATGAPLLGCSTAGEIMGDQVSDETLSVAIAEFEATPVRLVAEPISSHGSFDAGVSIARPLVGDDLKAVFVLSDGLDVNGTESSPKMSSWRR
jgi:hypothetical protein